MMELVRVEHLDKKYKEWTRIEWNMGKRCNFDCSYCGSDLHDNTSNHAPLENFNNTIKKLRHIYSDKNIRIGFTGGEPFVHPNILDILELTKSHRIDETHVTTNGSVSLETYIKALPYIDNIIFSWHFEYLRTEHMKKVLLGLNGNVNHMHVHLMFLPGKLEETKNVVYWLEENNIKYSIRRIRALTNAQGEFNPPGESGMRFKGGNHVNVIGYYSDEELEYLDSFSKSGNNADNCELFTNEKRWFDNINTLVKNKWNTFQGWKCMAGIESLMIDSDGYVFRATCRQGGILGNVNTEINLDQTPILCSKKFCNCAADINITKWKEVNV